MSCRLSSNNYRLANSSSKLPSMMLISQTFYRPSSSNTKNSSSVTLNKKKKSSNSTSNSRKRSKDKMRSKYCRTTLALSSTAAIVLPLNSSSEEKESLSSPAIPNRPISSGKISMSTGQPAGCARSSSTSCCLHR